MTYRWGVVAVWASICWCAIVSGAAGELIVFGPGNYYGPVGGYGLDDFHILAGTKVAIPSVIASAGSMVSTSDAIVCDGSGQMRIDGGEFSGGDTTYNGPRDAWTEIRSGAGARISASMLEIRGGTFRGGTAFSTYESGWATAGIGLSVSRSEARIYGGVFEGGDVITPNAPYYPSNYPSRVDFAIGGSTVHLHGGKFSYVILTNKSVLHIYGRDLVQDFATVQGRYVDGTRLFFTYYTDAPGAIVLHNVPEPGVSAMLLVLVPALRRRRRGNS